MLNFLARLLGAAPDDTLDGLCLDMHNGYWSVDGPAELPGFLRALRVFAGPGTYLFLEGGSPDGALESWIRAHMVSPPVQVARGNIWPRTDPFHVPINAQTLEELARLSESIAYPELAVHCHVYTPERMILQWHDAFEAPMMCDVSLSEPVIANFAQATGCTYTMNPPDG